MISCAQLCKYLIKYLVIQGYKWRTLKLQKNLCLLLPALAPPYIKQKKFWTIFSSFVLFVKLTWYFLIICSWWVAVQWSSIIHFFSAQLRGQCVSCWRRQRNWAAVGWRNLDRNPPAYSLKTLEGGNSLFEKVICCKKLYSFAACV